MSHGYSLLEMVKIYEKKCKKFGEITQDIMENDKCYCGILQLTETLDLLFYLYKDQNRNSVNVCVYRGFPLNDVVEGLENNTITMYLSQAIRMFPEIKKIEFKIDKFPKPYGE
jgi:hypothetical protein